MTSAVVDTKLDRTTKLVLAALIVGALAAVLDTTIVTIAINSLAKDLHSSVAEVQWVSTGYLLALAIAIPLVGWAQARFGGKRVWIFALLVFVGGSILCALAWNVPSLITFRVIQGFGGGMIFPLLQTIAMQSAAGRSLGRITATVSLPVAAGPILGPVVGGIILNSLDWRWLFLVNVPVVAVGVVLALKFLPKDAPLAGSPRKPLDFVGFALIAPALVGLLLGLSDLHQAGGVSRLDVYLPLALGAALLAGFVGWAIRRGSAALIDIRLLKNRSIAASSIMLFIFGATMYGSLLLLPLYFQTVRGFDVLGAAFLLIPQGIGSLLSRTVAGRLTDRFGARWVAFIGFLVVALATVPFAFAGVDTNQWWLGAVLLVRGVGLGAVLIPVMTSAFIDLPRASMPHASMITRVAQQLGGSFGTAIVAIVLQGAIVGTTATDVAHGFDSAFWWTIGFAALAVAGSLLLPVIRKTARPAVTETAPVAAEAAPGAPAQAPARS